MCSIGTMLRKRPRNIPNNVPEVHMEPETCPWVANLWFFYQKCNIDSGIKKAETAAKEKTEELDTDSSSDFVDTDELEQTSEEDSPSEVVVGDGSHVLWEVFGRRKRVVRLRADALSLKLQRKRCLVKNHTERNQGASFTRLGSSRL